MLRINNRSIFLIIFIFVTLPIKIISQSRNNTLNTITVEIRINPPTEQLTLLKELVQDLTQLIPDTQEKDDITQRITMLFDELIAIDNEKIAQTSLGTISDLIHTLCTDQANALAITQVDTQNNNNNNNNNNNLGMGIIETLNTVNHTLENIQKDTVGQTYDQLSTTRSTIDELAELISIEELQPENDLIIRRSGRTSMTKEEVNRDKIILLNQKIGSPDCQALPSALLQTPEDIENTNIPLFAWIKSLYIAVKELGGNQNFA